MGESLIYLLEKTKRGDEEATLQLLQKFLPLIRKYTKILYYEDAENDLTEAFLKIIKRIDRISNEYEILLYIDVSMQRAYIKLSKQKEKFNKETVEYNETSMPQTINPDTSLGEVEFMDFIDELDDLEKKIILYKYYFCYQINEIASILKVSRQTVYKREKKAINELKFKLTK